MCCLQLLAALAWVGTAHAIACFRACDDGAICNTEFGACVLPNEFPFVSASGDVGLHLLATNVEEPGTKYEDGGPDPRWIHLHKGTTKSENSTVMIRLIRGWNDWFMMNG